MSSVTIGWRYIKALTENRVANSEIRLGHTSLNIGQVSSIPNVPGVVALVVEERWIIPTRRSAPVRWPAFVRVSKFQVRIRELHALHHDSVCSTHY